MTTKTTFFLVASATLAAAGLIMLILGSLGGIGCLAVGGLGVLMHFHSKRNGQ